MQPKTTFYIASPFDNFPQVRDLATLLIECGWAWANDHNWTLERFSEARPIDHPFWPRWAVADMHAAMAADVFVLLLKGRSTAGAHAEFGARWATHRTIHAVRQGGEAHLFHTLPGIMWHDQVEDFLAHVFGEDFVNSLGEEHEHLLGRTSSFERMARFWMGSS